MDAARGTGGDHPAGGMMPSLAAWYGNGALDEIAAGVLHTAGDELMPPPKGAGTNALRTTRNLGARRGWREGRQAIKRASLSRPVSLQPNLRLPRSAAIGDIPPPSSTKPRSVPPRQQCGAASKEPAEAGSSPEGSMDARAPASMRLLLSYSRARRSILLSQAKGGGVTHRGSREAPKVGRRGAFGET